MFNHEDLGVHTEGGNNNRRDSTIGKAKNILILKLTKASLHEGS